MPTIQTWGVKKADFDYSGNVSSGIDIVYGKNGNTATYSSLIIRVLLHRFAEETIRPDTLEGWICDYKTRTGHSQYIASVLEDLNEVKRIGDLIHFHQSRSVLTNRNLGL